MSGLITKPAALLFTEEELGGPCFEKDGFVPFNTSPLPIVDNNGDRVGLLIFNMSAVDLYLGLQGNITALNTMFISANGGFLSLSVRDDFTLASRQWFGVGQSGGQVYVLEIIRYRNVITDGGV